jgi:hypothetical protein
MNWRDHLRRLLALRCEESSLLASQELDEPLGTSDRLAMWGHVLACRSCRRFRGHLRQIREVCRRREAHRTDLESVDGGLSPESRRRIAGALWRAANNGFREENG